MNGWNARQNIQNYRKQLASETDTARRRILKEMLAEQQQILAGEQTEPSPR